MRTFPDQFEIYRGLYTVKCVRMGGPTDPEQWYWHLFKNGQRVNGGLNDSPEEAMWAAGVYFHREDPVTALE